MTLRVLYFASLKDRARAAEEAVDVPAGTTVGALWEELSRRHPGLASFTARPLVACDKTFAAWETSLDGVREVAFLPPFSGG
ncbi:MAG TPA: MoaD/ThiS family protein [Candidatus Bathyarchaeia archaeon]|nr:MoaD/ThiS family protein [Candidatus Bathyarchaeia archaeon]